MIVGMDNNKQWGIGSDGIAYAGHPGGQQAAWFSGDDSITIASPYTGILQASEFLITMELYKHTTDTMVCFYNKMRTTFPNPNTGWSIRLTSAQQQLWRGSSPQVITTTPITGVWSTLAAYSTGSFAGLIVNSTTATGTGKTIAHNSADPVLISSEFGVRYWIGVIRNIRLFGVTGLSEAQIQAIAANPTSAMPAAYWAGYGIANANWTDQGTEAVHHGSVQGTLQQAIITPAGKVIVGGVMMNP